MCNSWKMTVALVLIVYQESVSLSMVDLVIPGYRVRGETALLECRYELHGDTLYSVKWYKDNEEFYRFMPKLSPPKHSYRIEGVKVDDHLSDDKSVYLKSVTLKTSGMYRCEVSAEAPSFSSASSEGRMEVVYLPRDGPHISGQKEFYNEGDLLNLNCTSGRSFPASILQWFINDDKITNPEELVRYTPMTHRHGLVTSVLGVRLRLRARHLRGGNLRARCTARLSPALLTADRESLGERVAPLVDNKEALLLVKSAAPRRELAGDMRTMWTLSVQLIPILTIFIPNTSFVLG